VSSGEEDSSIASSTSSSLGSGLISLSGLGERAVSIGIYHVSCVTIV
jgi:hypothetical protein